MLDREGFRPNGLMCFPLIVEDAEGVDGAKCVGALTASSPSPFTSQVQELLQSLTPHVSIAIDVVVAAGRVNRDRRHELTLRREATRSNRADPGRAAGPLGATRARVEPQQR